MGDWFYRMTVRIRIAGGGFHSRFLFHREKEDFLFLLCFIMFLAGAVLFGKNQYTRQKDEENLHRQQQELAMLKKEALKAAEKNREEKTEDKKSIEEIAGEIIRQNSQGDEAAEDEGVYAPNGMLAEYASLYEKNKDVIGWLSIDGTVIDYPVMQTPEEEEYYLRRDFYGKENQNGCLILDTDSVAGKGRREKGYEESQRPSSNLIIHGHTMKTGAMFGTLERYKSEEYGEEHRIICFDSLYEKRQYELISVFYSQVYKKEEKVFKYYRFFQADSQEEFDDWYQNIKKLSLYDTGVTAGFGDEFITLSCCAYPNEDKRFVVVGKRIR